MWIAWTYGAPNSRANATTPPGVEDISGLQHGDEDYLRAPPARHILAAGRRCRSSIPSEEFRTMRKQFSAAVLVACLGLAGTSLAAQNVRFAPQIDFGTNSL